MKKSQTSKPRARASFQHRNFGTDGIGQHRLRDEGTTENDTRVPFLVRNALRGLIRRKARELRGARSSAGTQIPKRCDQR